MSHDCDVVQPSYDAEPYIEFVIAKPHPSEEDGNLLRGKNPRFLQLWGEVANSEQLFQINVHDRHSMSRNLLEFGAPDPNCRFSKNDIRMIARWLAKRYVRSAFPTAFNKRIPTTISKKLRKALATNGKAITGIFVTFFGSDSELPEGETYQIAIRLTIPTATDQKGEMQAIIASTEIQQLLAHCAGIDLIDITVVTESEFSLEDYNLSRMWDFDYLSVDDDEV